MHIVTIKYQSGPGLAVAKRLFKGFPKRICRNWHNYQLAGVATEQATIVELVPFGRTQHAPDVWVLVQFADAPNDNESHLEYVVRHLTWFVLNCTNGVRGDPSVSLNVFWGPGHGLMRTNVEGTNHYVRW